MKLTIGMATYNDFNGVYFTVQALRLYQDLDDCEILVVDNYGCDKLKVWIETWCKDIARYVRYTDVQGTTQSRQKVFDEALGDWVLCIDSHVMLSNYAIREFKEWLGYECNKESDDLIHGPMMYDNLTALTTHMEPVWRDHMWGIWADVVEAKDLDTYMKIPMHGLGLFGARRESWLGFNPNFKGFGGEEGYIHEKYRQAGRDIMCLSFLKWNHRFCELVPPTYPVNNADRIMNYLIGFNELGLSIEPIKKEFGDLVVSKMIEKSGIEFDVKEVLLIGNGPAALSKEMGKEIDAFKGKVVRFNAFVTNGKEQFVGEKTDVWFTVANYGRQAHAKETIFFSWGDEEKSAKEAEKVGGTRIEVQWAKDTCAEHKLKHPSSGILAAEWFLSQGYKVHLWGFDFLNKQRKHHYSNDPQKRGEWHNAEMEWNYFHKKIEAGEISWFNLEDGESFPIFHQPLACGRDDDLSFYRVAAHNAWYEMFGKLGEGSSFLDVGAGMGEGMKVLQKYTLTKVKGTDVDERLKDVVPNITITETLEEIADKSYDVITCVDVIEHIVKDMAIFRQMQRIARKAIYFTTPCYARSGCGNPAHCREYTIPQFVNLFKPDKVWSASPDGKVHTTLLLEKVGNLYLDRTNEGVMNKKETTDYPVYKDKLPIDLKFNKTVDGKEWAHIAAVCYL